MSQPTEAPPSTTATFDTYDEVSTTYLAGKLHPMDDKQALADRLIDLLEPARGHFVKPEHRAMLDELAAVA